MPEPLRCSVEIAASPEAVYPSFTRPDALISWMGDYAVIDPNQTASSPSTSTVSRFAVAFSDSARGTAS